MFTGLVEEVGQVVSATGSGPRRLTIETRFASACGLGDSVAIDGCCLTVVTTGAAELSFEAAAETLERTTIGGLRPGGEVNLERALAAGDRLDGHLVSGHVDSVGHVRQMNEKDGTLYIGIAAAGEVYRLSAARGSIAVAGVSLTLTDVSDGLLWIAVIPHTWDVTTLKNLTVGSPVNLEADLLSRYVARALENRAVSTPEAAEPELTAEYLIDKGFS